MNKQLVTNLGLGSKKITNKGKSAKSYEWVNGYRVPCWIIEHGGYIAVSNLICHYIDNKLDCHAIRNILNISSATICSYINKNLDHNYIIKEKQNRKVNSSKRRSLALTGIPSSLKGKTYKEIHGTDTPLCGFKRGNANPNFTRDKYIGCTLFNKSGKKFRSSYEVLFSEILEANNILYNYEHHYKLLNGKVKIVDFIIKDILVEVTGYAYAKWQQDFDIKINLLHKSYPNNPIVVICDKSKKDILKDKHGDYCNVMSLDQVDDILNTF